MNWIGLNWTGMDWNGLEWTELHQTKVNCSQELCHFNNAEWPRHTVFSYNCILFSKDTTLKIATLEAETCS